MYIPFQNFPRVVPSATLAILLISSAATHAQAPLPPGKVLVSNSRTSITYAEFEAELARVPVQEQFEFLLDKVRIAQLVENALINKTLAIEAREHKLDLLPRAQDEIRIQTDKVLAKYRGIQVQDEVPQIDFLASAREIYLTYPEKTTLPERHEVWHALVSTKGRTVEQAKSKAESIRKRLLAGESRESLAETLSEDTTAQQNKGDLGLLELVKLDSRFADATRKLKVGEVSMPFETSYGIHVVKLLGHLPLKRISFEVAKRDLIEEAKAQHTRAVWAEYLRRIQNDPKLVVDTEALDAIRPKLPEIPKPPVDTPPATGTTKAGSK